MMNDEQLSTITKEIDDELLKWLTTYNTSPLNLCGIMLARLTWLARLTECEKDFFELLKAPEELTFEIDTDKKIH